MQASQAANHTRDLLTQRIQLCCEILLSVNGNGDEVYSAIVHTTLVRQIGPYEASLFGLPFRL